MSSVSTIWPSIVSIMHDILSPSVDTFVSAVSSLDIQFHCFLTLAHPYPLIMTLLFLSLINIRYAKLFFHFSQVMSRGLFGSTNLRSWNCCNNFCTAASTSFWIFEGPAWWYIGSWWIYLWLCWLVNKVKQRQQWNYDIDIGHVNI